MSSDAIAIEKLGKRYTIGARQLGHTTFRESLTSMLTAPWRRFRHLSGNAEDATQF